MLGAGDSEMNQPLPPRRRVWPRLTGHGHRLSPSRSDMTRSSPARDCWLCNLILTSWWAGSSAELLEPAPSLANVPNSDENPQGYNPYFCSSLQH